MKITPMILIAGTPFKQVLSCEEIHPTLKTALGYCDFDTSTIIIQKKLKAHQQKRTAIHEWIEAMNEHFKMGLKHKQIELLEVAWYQLLQDNFELRVKKKRPN